MRESILALLLLLSPALPSAAAEPPSPAKDANGMRTYQLGFLTRGERWTPAQTDETRAIQAGHLAHIEAMARTGKLILAGPFLYAPEDGEQILRGIFLFDVADRAEAQALAAEDPAVKAGRLKIEFRTWYGPFGITYEEHAKYFPGAPGGKP